MVCAAFTAVPITAPDVPLIPLGRSTATIGAACAFMLSIMARGRPSTGRSRPAPNRASITTSIAPSGRTGLPAPPAAPGDRARPLFRCQRRIAFEPRRVAHQQHLHAVTALGEQPRRHKSVASVIAGARHHDDAAPGRMARAHGIGDSPARSLHKVDSGHAAGDGPPVGLRHFRIAEELNHHASRIAIAARREHCAMRCSLSS